MNNIKQALTPEEVAEILKIAKNTVYELIKRGELPAYRVGRKVRIDPIDLETYRNQGKNQSTTIQLDEQQNTPYGSQAISSMAYNTSSPHSANPPFIICGQDPLLDILTNELQHQPIGTQVLRSHIGSYTGLTKLYYDQCHMTACHLWDGDSNTYNIPYVRRLLPGIPCVIIHVAKRVQGFYVPKGNPKNFSGFEDLTREDIVFINREKGSGTRILLDEHLRKLSIERHKIKGYNNEETSHLSIASALSRGLADVGMGCENVAKGISTIDFIPLQTESYDLVVKMDRLNQPLYQLIYDIIRSESFKLELAGLGGYDISDIGTIVGET